MNKIRLVHVTTVPQTLSFLRPAVAHARGRGFEIHAVSSPGPELETFGRRERVAVRAVPMPRRITPWGDLLSTARLARIFLRLKPRVVHAHTPKGGLLGMLAAWAAGVRARVYTLHGLPHETARGLRGLLLRLAERVSCLLAHRVLAVSPSLRARAVADRLCRPEKIAVPGKGTVGGVDADAFRRGPESKEEGRALRRALGIPSEARVIAFVGRVVRDKGVPVLADAWKRLAAEFPEAHLLVVGPFEAQDPVPPATERLLRSHPRVRLTGPLESTRAAYAAADVVALPTWREGFPQVPLEAAAMELPVVATRVTGCVDAVVDGVTGTLVEPGDPAALAGALRAYLRDPGLGARHGQAGRDRVLRDFRPEVACEATQREYERLLGSASANPPGGRRHRGPRPVERLVKRLLDVGGSAFGLALLWPLMLVVAAAIRLTLGRPVLFRHRRPGQDGKPFMLLKFRTMRPGTASDEERMTRLGRLLRATSLDELPQLWNVLRGDMSLVGPRPLLMEYLTGYSREQARRHDVPPGLTGWSQVNGRNGIAWDLKFALDLWYVDHWSLLLDLNILARTVGRVWSRKGVDGPGSVVYPAFVADR